MSHFLHICLHLGSRSRGRSSVVGEQRGRVSLTLRYVDHYITGVEDLTSHNKMMKLVVLALCLAYVYSCGVPAVQPILSGVVNGHDVLEHSWPWQVSFQYQVSSGVWEHTCGGTLISDSWVLTAAHCISPGRVYRVLVGKHNLQAEEEGSAAIGTQKIFVHEQYSSSTINNDIALIKLAQPAQLSASVQPACLPADGAILPHGSHCYVTGWGSLCTNGPIAENLQQDLLPVVEHDVCSESDWWSFQVTDTMICTGGDGCSGDSGGPLICPAPNGSWEVHGVASSGSGISRSSLGKWMAFTRVPAFWKWITDIILQK